MLTTFIIFIIVFFLYVHIIGHYKTSEDLEIYEMDYVDNQNLQEVCDVKQPTTFEFSIPQIQNNTLVNICETYGKYTVKVRTTEDYYVNDGSDKQVDFVPLALASYGVLAKTDTRSRYFTYSNEEFMSESGLRDKCEVLDEAFKPPLCVFRSYDFVAGSPGCTLPMQYHTHYRRFLYVCGEGAVHVKLTPWKSRKYLHPVADFENYEFRSKMNVFDIEQTEQYSADYANMKFLDCVLKSGHVLYVPPYWWYSVQFSSQASGASNTYILSATYDTAISMMAAVPDMTRHFIQQYNTANKIARTFVADSGTELEKTPIEQSDDNKADNTPTNAHVDNVSVSNVPNDFVYPSGEPYTGNAAELADRLRTPNTVPIREQHQQIMEHILAAE